MTIFSDFLKIVYAWGYFYDKPKPDGTLEIAIYALGLVASLFLAFGPGRIKALFARRNKKIRNV